MSTEIIISLIFGGASIITSIFFGLIPNLRKDKIDRLERKVARMAKDIDSFFTIEDELLAELADATAVNKNSKKNEVRKKVSEKKGWSICSEPARNKKEFQ